MGHTASKPIILGKPTPSSPCEARYKTLSEPKLGRLSETKSRISYSASRPEIHSETKPSSRSESRYRTLREPRLGTLRETKPGIRSESKPGVLSESKFRTLSDSKSRSLSSPCYSYRNPDKIRPRTSATAGRRDRRSSLLDPSRKKDPYF